MQAAEPGHKIVNFDFKSFHVLTTGFEAESEQYMRLARLDMHSFIASEFLHSMGDKSLKGADQLFIMADAEMMEYLTWFKKDEKRKYIRDKQAKPTILGVGFGLGERKLFDMNREYFDGLRQVQEFRAILRRLFSEVFKWQDRIKQKAAEDKKLVGHFGAIRHFFDVQRWSRKDQKWIAGEQAEQAIAFLPASDAFGHMRWTLLNMRSKGYDERYQFINQIHDSVKCHCPDAFVDECRENVSREMTAPSPVLAHPKLCPGGLWVGVESQVGESNADLH
jgi:hypothetical protein